MATRLAIAILIILLFLQNFDHSEGWRRRRRRRRCSPSNCAVSGWSIWSGCSHSCGSHGTRYRTRSVTRGASCGGSCPYGLRETVSCNRVCCPVNCVHSWGVWGACQGCGNNGQQTRSLVITQNSSCGGTGCPTTRSQTRSCLPPRTNVCSYRLSYSHRYTVQVSYGAYTSYRTCCSHFLWCWKKCTRYRWVRRYRYEVRYTTRYNTYYRCCQGWRQGACLSSCLSPICNSPGCAHGNCIRPNTCLCHSGWTSPSQGCNVDINECANSNGGCQQLCTNLPGTHRCGCNRGYTLIGSTRCQDVNECATSHRLCSCDDQPNNPSCIASCSNTLGSYRCTCSAGYQLLHHGRCIDVNECMANNGQCSHTCTNYPGTHRCSCHSGYQLNSDARSCSDVNECSTNNGGCDHSCINTPGSFTCQCRSGYTLDPNGRTCSDIDECGLHYHGCQHNCNNFRGGFYCSCRSGYRLNNDNRTCSDINECTEYHLSRGGLNSTISGCTQNCHNIIGTFRCSCNPGYKLASDGKTCYDVDECLEGSHRCHQKCLNTIGSYDCQCLQGYKENADGYSCQAVSCIRHPPVVNGRGTCFFGQANQTCRFRCLPGFQLRGSPERRCQANLTWSGFMPICTRKNCKPISPPPNGGIQLPCLNYYQAICTLQCSQGFYPTGSTQLMCRATANNTMYWLNKATECKEITICAPNPCKHGGICNAVGLKTYQCNCQRTGYQGPNCNRGIVTLPLFPIMDVNRNYSFTVKAKPDIELRILLAPYDENLSIYPKKLVFNQAKNSANFTVRATIAGPYVLSYKLYGDNAGVFDAPMNSIVFFRETNKSMAVNIINDEGILSKGCHSQSSVEKRTDGTRKAGLTLYSTAPWQHRPNSESTDGMVLIDVEGTSGLPTSLVGSTITIESLTNNNFDEFVNKYRRIKKMNESDESRIPQCISVNPSNEYLAEAIELNSFAKTVAEGVNRRTPSLLNVFVEKSVKIFDPKDLVANIYSGNEVKRIFTKCSKVLLGIDENKKYFAFLTTQRVLLHIAEEEIDLKRDDVVCIFESINGNETLIGFPDSASESAVWESLTGFAGTMKGIHISAEDKKQIYRVFGEYSAVLSTNTFKMAFKLNGDMLMDTDEAFEFFVDGVKSIKSMSANGKIDLHVDDNFMGDIERTTFSSNGSVTFNSTDDVMGKQKVVLELENVSGRSSRYVMAGRVKLDKNVQMKYIIWAKVSGGLILGAVNLTNSDNIRSEMHSLNASIGLSLQGAITAYPGLHRIINDVLRDLYLAVSSSESLSRYCHETRGKEALKSLTELKRQLERVDRRLQVLVLKHSNMVDFLASKRIFEKVFTTFHVSVDKMEQWFKKLFNRTRVSRSIEACSLYSKGTLCLAHLCFKNCHIEILYQIPSKTIAERFNLAPDYENVTAVIGKLETDAMLGNHLKIPKGNHIVILINNTKTYSGFFNGSMEIFGRSTNVSVIFKDNKLEFSTKATLPDGSLTTVQVVADIKNVISGDEVVFNIKGFVANNSIIIEDINKVLHSKIHMVAQDVSERLEILEKAVNTSRKHKSKADLNVKRLEELFKKKAERANQVESALNRTNSQYQNIKLALNARLKHYENAVENYTKTIEQCAPKVCLKKCVPGLVTNICYEERYEHVTTQSCMLLSKHLTRTEMQEVSTERSYVNYFPKYNCWTRCPPLTGFFKKVFGKRKRRGIISFLAKKALEKVLKTGGEKVFEYLGGKEGAMGAKIGAMLPGPWGIVGMLVGGVIGSAFGSCEKLCKTTMVPRENFYIHYESVKVTKVIDYKERQCDDVVIRQKLGYKDGFECSSYSNCSENLVDVECVQRNYHCRSLRGVLKEKIKHILGVGDLFEDYERLSLLIENLEMQQRMAIKERRNVHQSFLAAKAIAFNSNYTYLLSVKSLANLNHILATEMHILELTKRLGSHPVSVQNGHYKFVTSKGTVATNMIALQMNVVRKDGPNSLAIALIDFKRMNVSISETVNEIIKLIPNLKARRRRSVGSDAEVSVSVDEMFRNATKTKCKLMERNILYLFEIANMFTVGVHQFEKSNLSIHNAELSKQNFTRSTQDILANTSVCHDKNSSSCSSDWLASLYSNTTQDSNSLNSTVLSWETKRASIISKCDFFTSNQNLSHCAGALDCVQASIKAINEATNYDTSSASKIAKGEIPKWKPYFQALFENDEMDAKETKTYSNMVIKSIEMSQVAKIYCDSPPIILENLQNEVIITSASNFELSIKIDVSLHDVTYTWEKDGRVLLEENTNVLKYQNVNMSVSGSYLCRVSNKFGSSVSSIAKVVYQEKPRIIKHPVDVNTTIKEEQSIIRLVCNFTGIPAPMVEWYFVAFNKTESPKPLYQNNTLFLMNATRPEQSGFYYCNASNAQGFAVSRNAIVHVKRSKIAEFSVEISFVVESLNQTYNASMQKAENVTKDSMDRLQSNSTVSENEATSDGNMTSTAITNSSESTIKRKSGSFSTPVLPSYLSEYDKHSLTKALSKTMNVSKSRLRNIGLLRETTTEGKVSVTVLATDLNPLLDINTDWTTISVDVVMARKGLLVLPLWLQFYFSNMSSILEVGAIKTSVKADTVQFTLLEPLCPVGFSMHSNGFICESCAAGTAFVPGVGCQPCETGTYQPEQAMLGCIACKANYTTRSKGSVSPGDCILKDQLTTTALPVTTTALPVTTTALPVTTTSQDATKVPVESQTFSDMPKKDSTTYTTVAFKGTKSAVESLEKGMDKKTILLIVGFTIAGIILLAVVIIIIIAMRRRVSNQIKADMQMKTWYIDDEIEDNTPDTHDEIHIGYSFGNPMYDSQVKSAVIMENERCGVEKTLSEC